MYRLHSAVPMSIENTQKEMAGKRVTHKLLKLIVRSKSKGKDLRSEGNARGKT